jgi:hypothetical protein
MIQLTVKEAIEQGYKYAGYANLDEQPLIKLTELQPHHFEHDDPECGPLVLCTLGGYKYAIDADTIMELVSDYLAAQDEVADEDAELCDLAAEADYKPLAEDINSRLAKKTYYDLTDIPLLP